MLATGMTLDEIPCGKSGTLDQYVPSGDYIVIKFARWAFEKFKGAEDKLGTQMKAVGEVMSIGKNFKEAFQKAIFALGLAANAVVPLENNVVNIVRTARKPAINLLNFCFTFHSSLKMGTKKAGHFHGLQLLFCLFVI